MLGVAACSKLYRTPVVGSPDGSAPAFDGIRAQLAPAAPLHVLGEESRRISCQPSRHRPARRLRTAIEPNRETVPLAPTGG
jgi:hypothetical protein